MKSAKKFGLFVSGVTSALISTAISTGTYLSEAQAANLVVNGSFEQDSLVSPQDPTRNNPEITGWSNSTATDLFPTILIDNYPLYSPHPATSEAGFQSVRLAGGYLEYFVNLSQNLNTVAGQTYKLSYSLASNDEDNGNIFKTYIDGTLIDEKINVPFQDYVQYENYFVATSNSTELKFSSSQRSGWYNLDVVSVTAVPEPSIIGGIAVTGLMGMWLRKKLLAN